MPEIFSRLAFVDIETTGGSYAKDRITEIGVLLFENGVQIDEFYTLVNPECLIPEFITGITGIRNEDVLQAPVFNSFSKILHKFLEGALFVAHNAVFDYKFIQSELIRSGLQYNSPRLCTVKLSRTLFPESRKHNLDSIIEEHNIDCVNRHRALDDAKVLPKFYKCLQEKFENEKFISTVNRLIDY